MSFLFSCSGEGDPVSALFPDLALTNVFVRLSTLVVFVIFLAEVSNSGSGLGPFVNS